MTHFDLKEQKTWLVTGVAGFIGSNLLEALLKSNQKVIGLDNFSNGLAENLAEVSRIVTPKQWENFSFMEGSITDFSFCQKAFQTVDYVLHQAALGSIPRSLKAPLISHAANVDGFINMLEAARLANIKAFVYASSSSVYGDSTQQPRQEASIGKPLSPYAASKQIDEMYAGVFHRCYELPVVGLRYFNVFGARQNPNNPYAAVIPLWLKAMCKNEKVYINGDGETSRDFCYVANVVQANILAALQINSEISGQVFNIACSEQTSLNELYQLCTDLVREIRPTLKFLPPVYREFRTGDIRHSLADISKARTLLGYKPSHQVFSGLKEALPWYLQLFVNQA